MWLQLTKEIQGIVSSCSPAHSSQHAPVLAAPSVGCRLAKEHCSNPDCKDGIGADSCPCETVRYCSKECQHANWAEHMTDCTWHKEQVLGGAKGAHHDKPAAPAPEKWVGKGLPPAGWNKEARRTDEVEGAHLQVYMSFHSLADSHLLTLACLLSLADSRLLTVTC